MKRLKEIMDPALAADPSIDNIEITELKFYRKDQRLCITVHSPNILPFDLYEQISGTLKEKTGARIELAVTCDSCNIRNTDLRKYLDALYTMDSSYSFLATDTFRYDEKKHRIDFLFTDEKEAEAASAHEEEILRYLGTIGMNDITLRFAKQKTKRNDTEPLMVENIPVKEEEAPQPRKRYTRLKPKDYPVVKLSEVFDPVQDVQFDAVVFAKEERETKQKKLIQSLSVYDGTDAIIVQRFEDRFTTREDLGAIKINDLVRFHGSFENNAYMNALTFRASSAEVLEKEKITDTAEEKRVELHMHSNMSEMDGVCDIGSIVQYFWDIGHRGFFLTDHADVQSFVKAFNKARGLKKSDPERKFKVGLGCEMNLTNDTLAIVYNENDRKLDDCTFVIYDLETTGLSCKYDHIIEFGAVKMKNGTVIDTRQMFIKPPVSIPPFITSKTNITNAMVGDAQSFAEAADDLTAWIGDGVLVAHNASFDYHFFNEELRRCGKQPLKNAVIDTLDMSRAILRDRSYYRLGNIARNYRIAYDEEIAHRADYDAEVLANVFLCLLNDARTKYDVRTIADLQHKIQDETAFRKVRKSHVCVIAKNQAGLKQLYQLITETYTKTLAVTGKAASEGDAAAEPRLLRSSLMKCRENLLVGSACLNGEVFELAKNGDDARLEEAMKFYDYIEIQPLSNYSIEIALGNLPDTERLKTVIRRIIDTAKKLNIPVVADSDAHYCRKDQKIFRDVYITAQGVGGVTHPLFIRNDDLRMRTKNPDQHIRLTDEMIREFAWLDDEELIDEIVIHNPNMIFDMVDEIIPVPQGTYPPHIEGANDKLRQVCYDTAKKTYEFNGEIPHQVTDRLDRELHAIIEAGYAVNYYISHLLVKKSNEDGYVVGSRGSVGSSFTATMSGITEVNPLQPHYVCPQCHYSEWIDDPDVKSGFDLPDITCPHCGARIRGNGHNIPFETFLGFHGDKVPDIDLNFSNEYQAKAHAFTKEVFGEDHAFRAGTIGGVQERTAYGYVLGYCEKMNITNMRPVMKDYLVSGCQDVKRTTGQHPGGIIIVPDQFVAEDFTPVQYPANDPNSEWKTTHYDFHDIHDNVLKFDILGHVDPTAMKLLSEVSEMNPLDVPMNDPETLSLFSSDDALHADPRIYKQETGALGLPEFGTRITRNMLEETRPKKFSDLVIISGLSHGTDVWANNSQDLVRAGHPLDEVIGCRDDIMTYLLNKELEPADAFQIMECVRKGKGLTPDQEKKMKEHHVPEWYIGSCKKIKYMFPKAHAVAYVMMGVRVAWYKVHDPVSFYIQYLSLRCDAYEIETMTKGLVQVRARMDDIRRRQNEYSSSNPVTNKEKALLGTLEVCEELYARGFTIGNISLKKSQATRFTTDPADPKCLIPPFSVMDGLGENVARSIVAAREENDFLSKEDLLRRTQISATLLKKLDQMGCLGSLQETNQMSLF